MNIVRLEQLEGYRQPAEMAGGDDYLVAKPRDAAAIEALYGGLDMPGSIRSERAESQNLQGVADYIAPLTSKIKYATIEWPDIAAPQAHLPRLFAERYAVDLGSAVADPNNSLVIRLLERRPSQGPGATLGYGVANEPRKADPFWVVDMNTVYGFANMYCDERETNLRGEANIAFMPGVREALMADVDLLLNSVENR